MSFVSTKGGGKKKNVSKNIQNIATRERIKSYLFQGGLAFIFLGDPCAHPQARSGLQP